jgi:hypothetical protein
MPAFRTSEAKCARLRASLLTMLSCEIFSLKVIDHVGSSSKAGRMLTLPLNIYPEGGNKILLRILVQPRKTRGFNKGPH